jgi:hypothetical protein
MTTSLAFGAPLGEHPLAAPAANSGGDPSRDDRTHFAFLAETSRFLGDSLDFQSTLETVAGLALPHFGTWCMVDVIETDGSIRRVAIIHPDAAKQQAAREYYARDSDAGVGVRRRRVERDARRSA